MLTTDTLALVFPILVAFFCKADSGAALCGSFQARLRLAHKYYVLRRPVINSLCHVGLAHVTKLSNVDDADRLGQFGAHGALSLMSVHRPIHAAIPSQKEVFTTFGDNLDGMILSRPVKLKKCPAIDNPAPRTTAPDPPISWSKGS